LDNRFKFVLFILSDINVSPLLLMIIDSGFPFKGIDPVDLSLMELFKLTNDGVSARIGVAMTI